MCVRVCTRACVRVCHSQFGLDSEDLHYLLEAYTILQEDDALLPYCSLPIATHPPTLDREAMGSTTAAGTPRKRGRPSLHDSSVSDHKTGCARSEGFYKVARAKIPTRTSSHARRLVEVSLVFVMQLDRCAL